MKIPDISHYNNIKKSSDWQMVKENVPFLISKATQGLSYVDPTLNDFIAGCEKNHIPYWLYTYLNKGEELAQTEFLVRTCKSKVGQYFVGYVLDIEAGNTPDNCKAAMDYLTSLGGKFMIYTGYAEYSRYKNLITNRPEICGWWEARYGKNSGAYNKNYPSHNGVDLHQFTSKGSCPGLAGGRTDLSRLTGKRNLEWFCSTNKSGVTSDTLYIRKGPGTDFKEIGDIPEGTRIPILEEVTNVNGKTWYKIQYKGITGYCSGKYVDL